MAKDSDYLIDINPTYVGMNRTDVRKPLALNALTPRMWG